MYLFTRSGRLTNGQFRESALWVATITEKVNQITDLQVGAWRNVFSAELGRITWATFVDDLSVLEAADDKLMVDDGYVAEVDRGAAFVTTGVDDALAQVIHGSPDPERPVEYASAVRTVIEPGKIARGMALGVEIAQRVEKVTGIPTLFLSDSTGDYGGVRWVSGYENVQSLQAANEKLGQDLDFLQFIDKEAAGVYQAGLSVTTQTILRRLL